MTDIVQSFLSRRFVAPLTLLLVLSALISACADDSTANGQVDDPAIVAHAAFVLWSLSHGVQVRDVSARTLSVEGEQAIALVEANVRDSSSDDWSPTSLMLPVRRDESGAWQVSPASAVDRLVQAARQATVVAGIEAMPPATPIPVIQTEPATPTAVIIPTPPPPPEGAVIYQADWSAGLDGWIGTPDWHVVDGVLVNDGTRSERDPWLEAPVTVDPWQSMIVEFQAEVPASAYGSFGLVSRAGGAGWYEIGLRWENFARGSGTPVATVGAAVRQETRRVREEIVAVRKPLTAGPHLYRAEFLEGEVRYLIDGDEVAKIPSGQFYAGEFLGLWSELTPLTIYSFRVTLV